MLIVAAAITLHFIFKKSKGGKKSPKTLVDPQSKYPLPLVEKEEINHDTRRFR